MTKNPFEIRAEVLALAKEYLDKQREMHLHYTQRLIELNEVTLNETLEMIKPYSFDDLMKKAEEMYQFVSTKG